MKNWDYEKDEDDWHGHRGCIIQDLMGKTFDKVTISTFKSNEGIVFKSKDKSYMLVHLQDCCEDIDLNDVVGDLADLENSEIIKAEMRRDFIVCSEAYESDIHWIFYEIATNKGAVTVRFCGCDSRYSVDVDLIELMEDGKYNIIREDWD